MLRTLLSAALLVSFFAAPAQVNFNYTVELKAVNFPGLPGLHSYAFAQHNGKWLIIGGREDGIHPRQPFNAFPASQNNNNIYVIDVNTKQFWTAPLTTLPASLQEQLQSTNMNFLQQEDTLYIIGGYAYSATAGDHITFPNLTTVRVSLLINAILQGAAIGPYFKQIEDDRFAVTGGQLGKIGNRFYLVGGHRFDGRYNPMGHATFEQTYTSQVRSFQVNNSLSVPVVFNYNAITDAIHLRRRDYNLLPQVFPDGSYGYTISSGVFQPNVDLPYLYPVDVTETGIKAHTDFNQYLSNYHSAKASLYDSSKREMYSLFFGGISQYYYEGESMVQDNGVPFVRTISLLTRTANGKFQEYKLPVEMPGLMGAGAEFIPDHSLPQIFSEITRLDKINGNEFLLGHIYGGINSSIKNAFTTNSPGATAASSSIYSVRLVKQTVSSVQEINGANPYSIQLFPNPFQQKVDLVYTLNRPVPVYYFISNMLGQVIKQGRIYDPVAGKNTYQLNLAEMPVQELMVTVVFENKFFVTEKLLKQ